MLRFSMNLLIASSIILCGSVHADMMKVVGSNVDFYYDSGVWAQGVEVSGNSFSLRTDGMMRTAYLTTGGVTPEEGVPLDQAQVSIDTSFNVIAVAHPGYVLTNNINLSHTAFAGGSAYGYYGFYIFASAYTGGVFSKGQFDALDDIGFQQATGSVTDYNSYFNPGSLQVYATLDQHSAISTLGFFSGEAGIQGQGLVNVGLTEVTYGFTVSAVPETEQYGLMSAGSALLSYIARRRRRSAIIGA